MLPSERRQTALVYSPRRGIVRSPLSKSLATHPRGEVSARPPADIDQSWQAIRLALRDDLGERTYDLWLAPLRCVGVDGDTLILDGPPEVAAWARARYGAALRSAAASVLDHDVSLAFAADVPGPATPRSASQREPGASLNPKYTFEQFVIGSSNRLAHAAALAVAEMPTQAYNPLFIYGPPGLGKTHLLHAIANYIHNFEPGSTVRYVTAEDFTNAFLEALGKRATESFKARFRDVDVLLVDDVQFLERKARSEEEMFHTFNTLYEGGSQLVVTC
ncbi:MAG TPA: DnaA/Hda family protein, partial [Solirubrobacteraceae bacterium]